MKVPFSSLKLSHVALGLLAASVLAAQAQTGASFGTPDTTFSGQVRVVDAPVVHAGAEVSIAGSNFKPGQQVRFFNDGQPIVAQTVTADAEGAFRVQTTIPESAAPGRYPIVVSATEPSAAQIYPLKVSPNLPFSGEDQFAIESEKLVTGLYQSAYSAKHNALFVTAAVGRPPVSESNLVKLDPQTLQVVAQVAPEPAPARKDAQGNDQPGGVFAVYGVGVDDTSDHVWVTNTRQNTLAVYKQSDLSLVKQFEPGAANHARDVVVDGARGKAYVSTAFSPDIEVFDTKKLEHIDTIEPKTSLRGRDVRPFASMSLALDEASAQLFVVSSTGEVAIIDTTSDTVKQVHAIPGVFGSSGVAYAAASKRIFVASQGSDDLAIVDAESGELLHKTFVGANALNVAFDPVSKLAYTSNRGSASVTVVNVDGEIVANLPGGPQPNHVAVGPEGAVYLVNRGGAEQSESNQLTRLQFQ